jgi:uncharacterized protein (TIGR02145 family)
MTVIITLTTAGLDTGPFDLFSDASIPPYSTAFDIGVTKEELEGGYPTNLVPDGTTTIRVQSVNSLCNNYIDLPTGITTTTTSTSSTTTTTSTTLCINCSAHTVQIGSQVWAGCNLDVTTYRDGTVIPQVTDPTAWTNLSTGAWCYYANNSANGPIYGKLYNIYAVLGIWDAASYSNPSLRKRLAPTGYHIPSDAEWTTLTATLGGGTWVTGLGPDSFYQPLIGDKLKEVGTCHWFPGTGTDTDGFTGLPGGVRSTNGSFVGIQGTALFASSTLVGSFDTTWGYGLSSTFGYDDEITKNWTTVTQGVSVRVIQD